MLLKLLPVSWLQPMFSKGFDVCAGVFFCVCVCAHCERDIWVSDSSDGECQPFSEEMKTGSRAKSWPETLLGTSDKSL